MHEVPENGLSGTEKSTSVSNDVANDNERDESVPADGSSIALPSHIAGSGALDRLGVQSHGVMAI